MEIENEFDSCFFFVYAMRNGGGRERREIGSKSGVNKGTRLESTYQ